MPSTLYVPEAARAELASRLQLLQPQPDRIVFVEARDPMEYLTTFALTHDEFDAIRRDQPQPAFALSSEGF